MNKPERLVPNDTIAVVSLSSGVLGEEFARHQLSIAEARLKKLFNLKLRYMDNALRGIDYLSGHPEARASDLKQAILDDDVKAIIVATGGTDTFKTIPFLMDDEEFISAVKTKSKVFLGFSDTTNNHLMFHRLGMSTFYGVDFLSDFGELDSNMLPYTEKSIRDMFFSGNSETVFESSPEWYMKRTSYLQDQIGTSRQRIREEHGFEILQGSTETTHVRGALLGGCIESLYEMVAGERFAEQPLVTEKYHLFPTYEEWVDKVLFLETSETKSSPEKLRHMIKTLSERIDYSKLRGVIVGKPQDNIYYNEYRDIWGEFARRYDVPVIYNVNYGHAYPHCIIPYDAVMEVDLKAKQLRIISSPFSN